MNIGRRLEAIVETTATIPENSRKHEELQQAILLLAEIENLKKSMRGAPEVPVISVKALIYLLHGLLGESGELCNAVLVKTEKQRDDVASEAGDLLWYLTGILMNFGISMEEVVAVLEAKMKSRRLEVMLSRGWKD